MTRLNDLSLGAKLAIIVVAMLVPSAWLLYKVVSLQQATIASAELKLHGLEYMHQIWKLSGAVADHRAMGSLYASKKASDADIITAKIAEVNAAIANIEKLDASLGNAVAWRAIVDEWQVLSDRLNGLDSSKFYQRHSTLLEAVASYGDGVSQASTLLFESEGKAHLLVDVIATRIPRMQSDLFALRRAVAAGSGEANTINVARNELAAKVSIVRGNANVLPATIDKLAKLDPSTSDALWHAAREHIAAAETYAGLVYTNMVMADRRAEVLDSSIAQANLAFRTSSELQGVLVPWLEKELSSRRQRAVWARNATVVGYLVLVGIALLIQRRLRRQISTSARMMVDSLERIANGELGRELSVTTHDEIGQALHAVNRLDRKLSEVVSVIRGTADTVGSAANDLSISNEELNQRTQSQASALEETASSMEEMTATVKQNAENALEANRLAAGMRERAEQGSTVVRRATEAMNDINSAGAKIGDIIGVIDEIAFQTNLLALNAAVEAARAGEQGRGFAVVASEVRNLAQRSASAAKDIKDLIKDSVAKVKTGSDLVSESGKTLAGILENVRKVTDIVAGIASASSQQSAGIDQVTGAVAQMDAVTQENAARVDVAATASQTLQLQADQLIEQISFFRTESDPRNPRYAITRPATNASQEERRSAMAA